MFEFDDRRTSLVTDAFLESILAKISQALNFLFLFVSRQKENVKIASWYWLRQLVKYTKDQHPIAKDQLMPHLICYDISKNSLRSKLAKLILTAGLDRINKSVYLGAINERSLKILEQQMAGLIKNKGNPTDSVIVVEISKEKVQQMRVYGENQLDPDELTGDKSTLII